MIEKFLEKTEFTSYEDFIENYSVKVPVNFNFAYDIVDEYAKNEPGKKPLSGAMTQARKKFLPLPI